MRSITSCCAASNATHAALCQRAERWLRSRGCGVTTVELVTYAAETPDVIGWRGGLSVVCEVKVSRSDFLRDAQKPSRACPGVGMGDWRIYVTPAGLLTPAEIPDGWGLLEAHGRTLRPVHGIAPGNIWGCPPFVGNKRAEALVLCSLVRRLQKPSIDRRRGRAMVATSAIPAGNLVASSDMVGLVASSSAVVEGVVAQVPDSAEGAALWGWGADGH